MATLPFRHRGDAAGAYDCLLKQLHVQTLDRVIGEAKVAA